MANGEVIKQVRDLLQDPKGMTGKQAQVMTLTLLLDLYEKWEADHDKVEKMWPVSRAVIWVGGAFGIANLSLLIGILTHTFQFP